MYKMAYYARNCNNKLMWYTDEFLLVSASLTEKKEKKKNSFYPANYSSGYTFLNVPGTYVELCSILYLYVLVVFPLYCVSPNKIAIEMLPISYIFIQLHDIWTLCNLYRNRRKRYVRQGYPKRCKIDA